MMTVCALLFKELPGLIMNHVTDMISLYQLLLLESDDTEPHECSI